MEALIWAELLCLAALTALPCFWLSPIADPHRAVSPVLLVSALTFLFFVIKPIVIVTALEWSFAGQEITTSPVPELLAYSLLIVALGYIAFLIGYFSRWPGVVGENLPRFETARSIFSAYLLLISVYGVLLLGVNVFLYQYVGGFPALSDIPRAEIVSGVPGKIAFVFLLTGKVMFAIGVLAVLRPSMLNANAPHRMAAVRLVTSVVLIGILLSMYLAGSRTRLLELFIVLAVVWSFTRRPISIKAIATLGGALLVVAVVLLPLLYIHLVVTAQATDIDTIERLLGSQRRLGDKIDTLMVIVDRMKLEGEWLLGGNVLGFLGQFFLFLPRDQPPFIHETQYFVRTYFPEAAKLGLGYPVPLFGTLYWNFGIGGVLIGSFLLGGLCRVLYSYACRVQGLVAALYGAMYFSLYSFYGGSLSQSIAYHGVALVFGLVILGILSGCRVRVARGPMTEPSGIALNPNESRGQ